MTDESDHPPSETSSPAIAGHGRNDLFPPIVSINIPIDQLRPAPRRVRRASKKQTARVRRSIEEHGFLVPVPVTGDGVVIDGHIRLEAARELGAKMIPCIRIDHLSEIEVRRLRIALNRIQETGEWDSEVLKLEFESLLELDIDLEITGFEIPEIDGILEIGSPSGEAADPLDDFGDLPASDAPAVTRPSDLWILGDHRILCGSARMPDEYVRLVGDRTVAMVFTDPPYNVAVNGHVTTSKGKFAEFAEASGEMTAEAFVDFLTETLGQAVAALEPDGILYAFMDWRHIEEMTAALRRLGLELLNVCVWVKSNGGMGSFYRSRHELVFVARCPGASCRNNVQLGRFGRNRTNVWEYAGATGGSKSTDDDFSLHPTVKPVRLVMDAILDVTAHGEIVLDPFLGSGTTLLAAERARRRCFGLEISPAYVDVAIRRWEEMTGGEAIHAETGETFKALRDARAIKLPPPPSEGDA